VDTWILNIASISRLNFKQIWGIFGEEMDVSLNGFKCVDDSESISVVGFSLHQSAPPPVASGQRQFTLDTAGSMLQQDLKCNFSLVK